MGLASAPTPHRKPGQACFRVGCRPQPGALKGVFVPWAWGPRDSMLVPAAAVPLCWAPGRLKALFMVGADAWGGGAPPRPDFPAPLGGAEGHRSWALQWRLQDKGGAGDDAVPADITP